MSKQRPTLNTQESNASLQSLAEDDGWAWGTSEWKPVDDEETPGDRLDRGFPDSSYLVELPSSSEFVTCEPGSVNPNQSRSTPTTPTGTKLLSIQKEAQAIQTQQEAFVKSTVSQSSIPVTSRRVSSLSQSSIPVTSRRVSETKYFPTTSRRNSELSYGGTSIDIAEFERLHEDHRALKGQFDNVLEAGRQSQTQNKLLQGELDQLKEAMRKQMDEMEIKDKELNALRHALELSENSKRALDVKVTRLTSDLDASERALSSIRRDGDAKFQDLEGLHVQQKTEIERLSQTVETLKRDLDERSKRASFLEDESDRKSSELKRLSEELQGCEKMSLDNQKLQGHLHDLSVEVRGLRLKFAEQERLIAARDAELDTHQQKSSIMSQQLQRQSDMLDTLQKQNRESQAVIQDLKRQLWAAGTVSPANQEAAGTRSFESRERHSPRYNQGALHKSQISLNDGSSPEHLVSADSSKYSRANDGNINPRYSSSTYSTQPASYSSQNRKNYSPKREFAFPPSHGYALSKPNYTARTPPSRDDRNFREPYRSNLEEPPAGQPRRTVSFGDDLKHRDSMNRMPPHRRRDDAFGLKPATKSDPEPVRDSVKMERRLMELSVQKDMLEAEQAKLSRRRGARRRADIVKERETAKTLEAVVSEINKLKLTLRRMKCL